MAKLKISENLFLEVAELKRMLLYLDEQGYKRIMKSIIGERWGIVITDNPDSFLVTKISQNSINVAPGLAFDSNVEAILNEENTVISLENNTNRKWVVLSRDVTNYESGTVEVSQNGVLTGTETRFMEVLRGQPNFPTKVKFNSQSNRGEYEVVQVNSDVEAILAGIFSQESDMKYSVVGTFTPGFTPLEENKQIYENDYFTVNIVESDSEPVVTAGVEFVIAMIDYNDGQMFVTDTRDNSVFNGEQNVQNILSEDSVLSLMGVTAISNLSNAEIELFMEHGIGVTSFQYDYNNNTFTVISCKNNFLQDSVNGISDNMLSGWKLINRKNMITQTIGRNVGGILYLTNFNAGIVTNENDDFVIVPNCNYIEYSIVSLNTSVRRNDISFTAIKRVEDIRNRISVYTLYPEQSGVEEAKYLIKYRLIYDNNVGKTEFKIPQIAPFVNIYGEQEILGDGVFSINTGSISPAEIVRNYS